MLWLLLIGLCAGWLAGRLMGSGMGLIGDLVIGVIGAFVGGWLFSELRLYPGGGLLGSLITATVGAMLLLFLIRVVRRV